MSNPLKGFGQITNFMNQIKSMQNPLCMLNQFNDLKVLNINDEKACENKARELARKNGYSDKDFDNLVNQFKNMK